jgi:site-specific DNA recombinase
MRVYTYARYSTDRQTEASIIDQQRRCHEYAAARAWAVAENFTDEGISGAALGNRPGFQQAIAKLQAGDVLLAADLTRVSRSQELAPLLDRLRFRGVRIIGILDGFDSESPQARMQAGLSGLMSDELRAGIRARTHSALQMRAMSGRATGGRYMVMIVAARSSKPRLLSCARSSRDSRAANR